MVMATSGFVIGYQPLEHRLVSCSGTRTVDDKEGRARKSKERRIV